ncbi:MAG TPA: pyridoxamine 5'-phosphate oxidase [Xanthomonadales bacterium]|nr:pyridoxamine 5'-phosphate oxidase [Xanthomonadales bacterium]
MNPAIKPGFRDMLPLSREIIDRFNTALHAARTVGELEPTAMVLATSDGQGLITSRTVLLKALDADGFVFFTNSTSNKGRQLKANPRASATFLWKANESQVQLAGRVQQVSDEEADAYFATRDRGSQIGAWASLQSQVLDARETLEQRVREFESKFEGMEVERPDDWTGFRLQPEMVEFWQGRRFRLHDRFRYLQENSQWVVRRLYP